MRNEPQSMPDILLAAINAKWIHPSLALRLLKANLGPLENRCQIIEFALRQPVAEKTAPIIAAQPRLLGLSVSIWNHTATLELLRELWNMWQGPEGGGRPIVVLGGPEVSFLPPEAEIFCYADYCIQGEGETAFRELCGSLFVNDIKNDVNAAFPLPDSSQPAQIRFVNGEFAQVNTNEIYSGYRLYTDGDLRNKLVYVEASRGCPFSCEFCLGPAQGLRQGNAVREFPLDRFLADMDDLLCRGAGVRQPNQKPLTFKFLDRSFNLNIERSRQIMEFFLDRITALPRPVVVHFEMVPSRFPPELFETLSRFPPGTLRLETGIQTLNPRVSARIGRPSSPDRELETLRLLREKTSAIIHADLIAGLPGEDMESFGRGFERLWEALSAPGGSAEIQLGILKLLPGASIARHSEAFGMRYNPLPPYDVMETAAIPACDMERIKHFARFWELIVNRGLLPFDAFRGPTPLFGRFMALSDSLVAHFGRSWGIDKKKLCVILDEKALSGNLIT
ncbi:MAG: cobalamin-dependent protein [Treponema sp.]|jgi:radical SAM superfamily enzyme YgiQ (UPF0313 family)|nr:cobalamin-dependent protein [Treponema sp.]